ncbi:MAG: ATP-dependent Clp protease proteolytic subunit [Clostridia bacterium]|nr:ATP-dependent Clp protease proteolytic subunit [Clostridia bacterium]
MKNNEKQKNNQPLPAELPPDEDKTASELYEQEKQNIKLRNISESGAIKTKNGNITIQTLTIAGQVEGHYALSAQTKSTKYEHILPQLVEVEENDDTDALLILVNTVGGDVEAGLAIAEMISGMSKPTASLVLGGGHSIGVPLAVSAKTSFIVPSATMTIHPVRMNGLVIGVPQAFNYFSRMQERIINFITRNSHVDENVLKKLMLETDELVADIGTVIDGAKAVEIGLIDKVGTLSDAINTLKNAVNKK